MRVIMKFFSAVKNLGKSGRAILRKFLAMFGVITLPAVMVYSAIFGVVYTARYVEHWRTPSLSVLACTVCLLYL